MSKIKSVHFHSDCTGKQLYGVIYRTDQILTAYNVVAGAFEDASGGISDDYAIAMTEGGASGIYQLQIPAALLVAGCSYNITIREYEDAGLVAADADKTRGSACFQVSDAASKTLVKGVEQRITVCLANENGPVTTAAGTNITLGGTGGSSSNSLEAIDAANGAYSLLLGQAEVTTDLTGLSHGNNIVFPNSICVQPPDSLCEQVTVTYPAGSRGECVMEAAQDIKNGNLTGGQGGGKTLYKGVEQSVIVTLTSGGTPVTNAAGTTVNLDSASGSTASTNSLVAVDATSGIYQLTLATGEVTTSLTGFSHASGSISPENFCVAPVDLLCEPDTFQFPDDTVGACLLQAAEIIKGEVTDDGDPAITNLQEQLTNLCEKVNCILTMMGANTSAASSCCTETPILVAPYSRSGCSTC